MPRKQVILPSNCDQFRFVAPHSDWVSVDVYIAWNFGHLKEGLKRWTCPERMSLWWCDGREFRQLKRIDARPYVLGGSPSTPWSLWITTSYKKHGSIRTPVNQHSRGVIGFDEMTVDARDTERVIRWWWMLTEIQSVGIGRSAMENPVNDPPYLKPSQVAAWQTFKRWAVNHYRSPLYTLLCYLLPSRLEMDEEADCVE